MGTDMRGFKVVYKERVYNALEWYANLRKSTERNGRK